MVMETMNGERLKKDTKNPVMEPNIHPVKRAAKNEKTKPKFGAKSKNTQDVRAITEPIEMSSLPHSKTKVRPIAAMPYPDIYSKRPKMFIGERKRGRTILIKINKAATKSGILFLLINANDLVNSL